MDVDAVNVLRIPIGVGLEQADGDKLAPSPSYPSSATHRIDEDHYSNLVHIPRATDLIDAVPDSLQCNLEVLPLAIAEHMVAVVNDKQVAPLPSVE